MINPSLKFPAGLSDSGLPKGIQSWAPKRLDKI